MLSTAGRTRVAGGFARTRPGSWDRRCPGEIEQVLPLRLVQLQSLGQRLQNRVRDPRQVPTLEAGVVVETHPGQRRDLLTTQPRHPPLLAVGRHPGLRRGDPSPAARQEVVHGLTIHTSTLRAGHQLEEGTASTRVKEALPLSRPTLMT